MADSVRIDKYVWAIRLYKTRSDATEACNGNKVQLNGAPAKPSKAVKIGDTISVRKGVALYTENLTPQSELDKLRAPHETFFVRRDRGAGRPTKKDRREMDAIWDGIDFSADPFEEDSEDEEEDV